MKLHRVVISLALSAWMLSGCVIPNRYVQPKADNVAKLAGASHRNGVFDWEFVAVHSVDDKSVPAPFMSGTAGVKVALTPEPHRILAHTAFNRQFGGGGPYEAFVALDFNPVSNGSYRLGSKVRDNLIEVWVEDVSNGEPISAIFSAPFQSQPKNSVYVPIFIPAGR